MNRSPMIVAPALLLAAAFPSSALGQTSRVVPANAANLDANASAGFPFAYDQIRAQQVWDKQSLGTAAVLREVAWRGEIRSTPLNAFVLRALTASVSHTSVGPKAMSATFASNITATPTVVFRGDLNVPAQANTEERRLSFAIRLPFARPFSWTAAQGHLLLDLQTPEKSIHGRTNYFLDAAIAGGNAVRFGRAGRLSTGSVAIDAADAAARLRPGGTLTITTTLRPSPLAGAIFFGADARPPIDLTAAGAPGNTLYVRPELGPFPHAFRRVLQGLWTSTLQVRIPDVRVLVGATFYAQSLLIDPQANTLGIVTTRALALTIGDATPPRTQLVGTPRASRPTGIIHFARQGGGGAVVRFAGTFR